MQPTYKPDLLGRSALYWLSVLAIFAGGIYCFCLSDELHKGHTIPLKFGALSENRLTMIGFLLIATSALMIKLTVNDLTIGLIASLFGIAMLMQAGRFLWLQIEADVLAWLEEPVGKITVATLLLLLALAGVIAGAVYHDFFSKYRLAARPKVVPNAEQH